jgi:dTDP-4-dehydrorhamnose 3,5-epimerase
MKRFVTRTTSLAGVVVLERRRFEDARGSFSRLFSDEDLHDAGWSDPVRQVNHSSTTRRGTVRGLHYQAQPHTEDKLVTCLRGAILDVAVDLRSGSPTFLQHVAVTLSADNRVSLLIPRGCAHGFQALTDGVEMIYLHSERWVESADRGIDPLDPGLSIAWPLEVELLSSKDRVLPRIDASFAGIAL